ncbi:SIS domain-containing protein [Hoeflea sp.]|uniref:SIS domain-containing protein n=1 Tax=Hoeflea sp. TaxID=1940281 RepID=UPI003A8E6DE8
MKSDISALEQLRLEMANTREDAVATWHACNDAAAAAAGYARSAGRLVLLGMGGSHWMNIAAVPQYRAVGLDATAEVLSSFMRMPQIGQPAVFLTSQSGESGEVVRFLDTHGDPRAIFGLTLAPQSTLARRTTALIGQGGQEKSYAATRSLIVTLAIHARILGHLGLDTSAFEAALETDIDVNLGAAVARLRHCDNAVLVARGASQGMADAAALSFMELARVPVLALEAGQFRHGPFEMIDAKTAIIMLRGQGPEGDNIDGLARECLHFGLQPVIFDYSGGDPVEGCINVMLPACSGLAAVTTVLPVLQRAIVDAAALMVTNPGAPVRSTKVTSAEAAG